MRQVRAMRKVPVNLGPTVPDSLSGIISHRLTSRQSPLFDAKTAEPDESNAQCAAIGSSPLLLTARADSGEARNRINSRAVSGFPE